MNREKKKLIWTKTITVFGCRVYRPNETKMSDGGRRRASLGVEV
jgi:hypothetical protein